MEDDLARCSGHVMEKTTCSVNDVPAGRECIAASIGWAVHAHHLSMAVRGAGGHGDGRGGTAGHGGHR